MNDEADTLLIVYQRGFADGKRAAERKPLSEKQVHKIWRSLTEGEGIEEFARAIERAHNIKEQP